MTSPNSHDGLRKVLTALVAVCAVSLVLTSGPRSLSGGYETTLPESTADETATALLNADVDDPPEVLWKVLAGLDYANGSISDELEPFVGQVVKVPGFMLPLEDWAEEASEFLLVPYVGACVHTPPPPPNQLVYVEMEGAESVPVSFWDPVWIHGTLEIEETTNVYGSVSFTMTGTTVEPYEW